MKPVLQRHTAINSLKEETADPILTLSITSQVCASQFSYYIELNGNESKLIKHIHHVVVLAV